MFLRSASHIGGDNGDGADADRAKAERGQAGSTRRRAGGKRYPPPALTVQQSGADRGGQSVKDQHQQCALPSLQRRLAHEQRRTRQN